VPDLVPSLDGATLSNCGDILMAHTTKRDRKRTRGPVDWGMVKEWEHSPSGGMDNPQPIPKAKVVAMDAVHRLNDSGPVRGLSYSRSAP
jgi:hypothetical protein